MKLEARISLTLPSSNCSIKISYNTYEKATYDQYLAASIVANANSKSSAETYINDITGKGSLNEHFKKLVESTSVLSKEVLNKILENSVYPITKIDTFRYEYFPLFEISIYNKKVIKGDISKYSHIELQKLFMFSYDIVDVKSELQAAKDKSNVYLVKFTDGDIEFQLCNEWLEMSGEIFENSCKIDINDIGKYHGKIHFEGTGDGWIILNNGALNNLLSSSNYLYDIEGNHISINENYLKYTELIKAFGLYFYRETKYEYIISNSNLCLEVIKHLFKTNSINEIKTKTILKIISVVDVLTQQLVINFILDRKDSKDITTKGLELLNNGLEIGWNERALLSMKQLSNNLNLFYKINPKLGYTDLEVSTIDNDLLSNDDLKRKKLYLENRKNIINECNRIMGEIVNSGIREKMKKLKASELTKRFTSNLNKMLAHKKDDITNYDDEELSNYYGKIKNLFNDYQKVSKELYLVDNK